MAYDVHVVRTRNWLDASTSPITKQDVDAALAGHQDLEWCASDYVEMAEEESGAVTRYPMIAWNGAPCFWWYREEIRCSGPDEKQILKLVQLAQALNAYVVGDDGKFYESQKSPSGDDELIILAEPGT